VPTTSFETTGAYSTLPSGTEISLATGYSAVKYETQPGAGGGGAGDAYIGDVLLPDGVVGQAYTIKEFAAPTGTATPITFSISAGSLPPGLSLVYGSNYWEITGTPTTAGTYAFTLQGVNSAGTTTQSLSIVIHPPSGGGAFTFAG
jgi:hypothetical protein